MLLSTFQTSDPAVFCVVGGIAHGGLHATNDILNVFTRRRILQFLFGQLSAHASGPGASIHTVPKESKALTQGAMNASSQSGAGAEACASPEKNLFDDILMFTVEQLGIVRKDAETVGGRAKLREVITTMVRKRIPRVVVLDNDGRAVEMYSRADIRLLSDEVAAVLDVDVVAAAGIHRRMCTFCTKNDTLQTVMQKMAWTAGMAGEVLVCVGPDQSYEGLVSFRSLFGILESKSNPNTVTAPVPMAVPGPQGISNTNADASSSIVEMEASTAVAVPSSNNPTPMDS